MALPDVVGKRKTLFAKVNFMQIFDILIISGYNDIKSIKLLTILNIQKLRIKVNLFSGENFKE